MSNRKDSLYSPPGGPYPGATGLCMSPELLYPRFANHNNNMITVSVHRTWRERLLSWPWRPWIQTRCARDDEYKVQRNDDGSIWITYKP